MARNSGYYQISKVALPILAATFLGGTAHAQNLADRFFDAIEAVQEGVDIVWPDDWQDKGVKARLGAGFGWVPDYVGSDNYRFKILPIVDVRYQDVWRLNGTTFTYNAYSEKGFETGPLMNLRFGRDDESNKALNGLGDIKTTVEVGAFARYSTKMMLLSADVRQALGAGQGLSIRATAGHAIFRAGDFVMGAGIRAKWYSKKAMQTNYGISAEQAANSAKGFEAFEVGAGMSEVSLNLLGAYRVNEHARLMSLVSFGKLLGDAANSPITGGGFGSENQFIAGTAVTFQF